MYECMYPPAKTFLDLEAPALLPRSAGASINLHRAADTNKRGLVSADMTQPSLDSERNKRKLR